MAGKTAGIVEKIKGFLFSPSETFDASKEDTLGDAFEYYIILLLIHALLSALIAEVAFSLFGGSALIVVGASSPFGRSFGIMLLEFMPALLAPAEMSASVPFIAVIAVFILYVLTAGAIGVLIGGLWLHIWVYLMDGRKGLTQTFKALMYGATPSLLLGWIPEIGSLAVIWGATLSLLAWISIIGFLASIWALIVGIISIRQLHEISTGRAVAAGILAIIPISLLYLFLSYLYLYSL